MVKKASKPVPRLPRLVKNPIRVETVEAVKPLPTHVNRERLAKTIFKPWPVSRIFSSDQRQLVKREGELTRLIHQANTELLLVLARIKGKEES